MKLTKAEQRTLSKNSELEQKVVEQYAPPFTYSEITLQNQQDIIRIDEEIANLVVGAVDTSLVINNNSSILFANQDEINVDLNTRLTNQEAGGDATFNTNQKVSDISLVGTDNSLDTSNTVDNKIALEATTRATNDITLQDNIDNESYTRLTNDNILQSNIDIESGVNDSQNLSIEANTQNILSLGSLIETKLLYAGRTANGNATVIGTSPVNLPLPNIDSTSIFESLDGGITFTLKAGNTLLAGTRLFWEQEYNFNLTQISTTDRGTLTTYINGVPYTIKEIDLAQNQSNGSFYAKNVYNVPSDTTTLSLTTQAVATNGNFTATLLSTSYATIFSQNATGSISTLTDNITYNGSNVSLAGQNQTQIDDSLKLGLDNEITRATGIESSLQTQIDTKTTITETDTKYYQIGNVPTPINDFDAANKQYVDSYLMGVLLYDFTEDKNNATSILITPIIPVDNFKEIIITIQNNGTTQIPMAYNIYFKRDGIIINQNVEFINNVKFFQSTSNNLVKVTFNSIDSTFKIENSYTYISQADNSSFIYRIYGYRGGTK